jgi:hypothetical protein
MDKAKAWEIRALADQLEAKFQGRHTELADACRWIRLATGPSADGWRLWDPARVQVDRYACQIPAQQATPELRAHGRVLISSVRLLGAALAGLDEEYARHCADIAKALPEARTDGP